MANTASHVRNCAVCEKDKPLESFIDISSDTRHQHGANTCRECFNKYLIQQVKEGQARAKCVECQVTLRYAQVKKIVVKTTLMNYEKVLLKLYVEEDEDFYYCMSAKCKSGQIHIGGEDMPIFCCKVCNHKQCMVCEIPWHEGETCDQYQARYDNEIIQTEALIRQTSKICPGGCGARIERNGGCPHMTCRRCGHEFCWLCLGDWAPHATQGRCDNPVPAAPEADFYSAEIQARQEMRQARQNLRDFDDEQAEAVIAATTKPCPKCKVRIEIDGGCDHMTCTQCSYEFCFECLADYKKILKHDNRRHKRTCVYHSGQAHGRVMPLKTGIDDDDDDDDEPSSSAMTKRRVTVRKSTVKNKKPTGVTKKKAVVASPVVRRGTRTGLRSSTAVVSGPVTRSQTAARG